MFQNGVRSTIPAGVTLWTNNLNDNNITESINCMENIEGLVITFQIAPQTNKKNCVTSHTKKNNDNWAQ